MEIDIIVLYALAVVGPLLIFLTHYVVKGRSRDMTRLWFISFFAYLIYYWLAKSYNLYNDPRDIVYCFALLWPIAAIVAFWIAEKLTEKGTMVPFFKLMVCFLVAVVFAFVLDGAVGIFHWYTYVLNGSTAQFTNPIGGLAMPAIMPLLQGVLMAGVFFLVFDVHPQIRKRRIDETSATLLLAGLSFILSGAIWAITWLVLDYIH